MNLQEAISTLTVYQEWRVGAEIPMLEPKQISEAIRIILDDHLHRQLETKPGFVEKREEQAWNIIEKMIDEHEESNDITLRSYGTLEYLKTICYPPILK